MYVSGYGQSLETLFWARAIDKVLAHADCQSAIQPIDNRRYNVAQTGRYRRLLTGYGCAATCADFVNGPDLHPGQTLTRLDARHGSRDKLQSCAKSFSSSPPLFL